ncbi:hypothetical protein CPC08DRAFT_765774 [Agrocybe pediades]|nr:hypothetical protein CPC08DRAFT_765774 [Agrocybe pediades]
MPIFCVAWLIWIGITAHWICCTISIFKAFIAPRDQSYCVDAGSDSRASTSFANTKSPWLVAEPVSYAWAAILADGFLIYRLFVVWSGNWWIIIFPSITVIGVIVVTTMTGVLFVTSGEFVFGASKGWTTAAFALTTAINSYSTGFIAYRIHKTQQNSQGTRVFRSTFDKIVEVLVQSAAIHCLLSCISLILMVIDSNAVFITVGMAVPTIGIIFSMIVTRTHDHITEEYNRLHNNVRRRSDSAAETGTAGSILRSTRHEESTPRMSTMRTSTIRTSTISQNASMVDSNSIKDEDLVESSVHSPSPISEKPVEFAADRENIV